MGCAASASSKEERYRLNEIAQFNARVEFGDEALVTYRSWEGDAREEHPDQPRHVPLPPSRGEHEKHLQRMEIFSKALSAHPLGFQSFIERQVPQS